MRTRTRVLIAVAAIVVAFGAWALYWFQPWLLFVNDTVHDALPPAATETVHQGPVVTPSSPAAKPTDTLLARGTFISGEHHTTGTASVVRLASGTRVLAIANLHTSEGPAVQVWLSSQQVKPHASNDFHDGTYFNLGDLKGNLGDLVYKIPDSVDLSRFRSVTIWCHRFNVAFGAANLLPVP